MKAEHKHRYRFNQRKGRSRCTICGRTPEEVAAEELAAKMLHGPPEDKMLYGPEEHKVRKQADK